MFTRAVIGLVALVSFGTEATAQSFSKDRLNDWEFRFYACKNVIMSAAVVIRLMENYQITDQSGIDEIKSKLGSAVAKKVTETENEYQFAEDEALFVSDLTFAVVSGMIYGGLELSDKQLIQSGNGLCIHTIETMAQ